MSHQPNDAQRFFLSGKAFHQINQLPNAEKTYLIICKQFTARLTKEQTILLSTSAYK
jgi:hypothetical protein